MNIREYIRQVLLEELQTKIQILDSIEISESLKYHIDNNLGLLETVYRFGSDAHLDLIKEVRDLYNKGLVSLCESDEELINSDAGERVLFEGKWVNLDIPYLNDSLNEAEYKGKKVDLNKPFRTPGGPKKFAVYVRGKSGNIKKVTFGDPNLKIKNYDPKAAKSFRARHKCSEKKDKETAGYWSCNVGRYAKALALSSNRPW